MLTPSIPRLKISEKLWLFGLLPETRKTTSILQLADDIQAGRTKQLFILGGDPVYNAPRELVRDVATKQPLDWIDLQKKVPEVVRVGYYQDATSAASHWHVPAAHYLEAWGDALTANGEYLAIQPMILPLFGGLSEIQILNALLGKPKTDGPELVQETFRASNPSGDFATAWSSISPRWICFARCTRRTPGGIQRTKCKRCCRQKLESHRGADR